jgi:hypothetical protein
MFRFITILSLVCLAFPLAAAPMLHVIGVADSHTLIVERMGVPLSVSLAGVTVPPSEEGDAVAYLRKHVVASWVAVELDANGAAYVFRSPDALYINGELARRAYAYSGPPMKYLGESAPQPAPATPAATSRVRKTKGAAAQPKPRPVRRQPRGSHQIPHGAEMR